MSLSYEVLKIFSQRQLDKEIQASKYNAEITCMEFYLKMLFFKTEIETGNFCFVITHENKIKSKKNTYSMVYLEIN